jgi:hypothetical protein
MASIRMGILDSLVDRLAAIPGWTARLRDVENPEANAPIVATVYFIDEDKKFATNEQYGCTMQVGVELVVRSEDVGAGDEGNAFRYLERQVVLLEKQIHAPDSWGPDSKFADVVVNGHSIDNVDGDVTSVIAYVLLTFTYLHALADPEAVV